MEVNMENELKLDKVQLEAFTVMLLFHPDGEQVLLLERSLAKKRNPGLMTGIGGTIELQLGEADDIEASMVREFNEETNIGYENIVDPKLGLVALKQIDLSSVLLFWFVGRLDSVPDDLSCTEGRLAFHRIEDILAGKLDNKLIHSARPCIRHYLENQDKHHIIHTATFREVGHLTELLV